jgi:hypothetical protein
VTAPTPTPTPYLRRDPSPSRNNGRWVLLGVLVFFLALVTFVVILVVTVGMHNHGIKIPPGPRPHATQPS